MPPRSQRVSVYVADDHPLYREALARAIKSRPDLELVGECSDGREALDEIRQTTPDVAVLDVSMPGVGGMDILNALKRDHAETRVLFVSGSTERDVVFRALASGAKGYLTKDASGDAICDAVLAVSRGDAILAPEVQAGLAAEIELRAGGEDRPALTGREQEILALTADGMSNREIGERLHLSPATIKTHLDNIYGKLGVSDRTKAAVVAIRRGLLE